MPTVSPPDENLYLYKPPPPYPGTSGNGSNAVQHKVDMTKSPSTTSAETPVIVSKEQSQSIKMGTSVSRIPPTDISSGSSRSVPSAVSVVSAEVHNIPNGKERHSAKEKSGAAGSSGVSTKSLHGPVPKTNGLLKEGNGTRKSNAVIHNENKVGYYIHSGIVVIKSQHDLS